MNKSPERQPKSIRRIAAEAVLTLGGITLAGGLFWGAKTYNSYEPPEKTNKDNPAQLLLASPPSEKREYPSQMRNAIDGAIAGAMPSGAVGLSVALSLAGINIEDRRYALQQQSGTPTPEG